MERKGDAGYRGSLPPSAHPGKLRRKRIVILCGVVGILLVAALVLLYNLRGPSRAEVRKLLERCNSPDESDRMKARDSLIELGGGAVPHLIEALDDPDENIQTAAIISLGKIRDERAVEPLLDSITALGPVSPQNALISVSLVNIGPPAVPMLIERLKKSRGFIQLSVIFILGEIKDKRAVPPLLSRLDEALKGEWSDEGMTMDLGDLKKQKEVLVAVFIIQTLGSIGDEAALETLRRATSDSSKDVRAAAQEAVRQIEQQRTAGG